MKKLTAAGALVAMSVVAVTAVQLNGQKTPQVSGDFRNAATAEVHDAQGQALLRGTFAVVDGDDKGEVERHAALAPLTPGTGASGEAEVEYQTDDPSQQEIELSATGMQPGAQFTLVIDGAKIATATADNKGKVEIELEARAAAR